MKEGSEKAGLKLNIQKDKCGRRSTEREKLKSPLMKVKEECENAGLKLNIQKNKIMASSPITSHSKQMG